MHESAAGGSQGREPADLDAVGSVLRPDAVRRPGWPRVYRWVAWFFAAYPLIAILTTHPDPVDAALAVIGTALFVLLILIGWRVPLADPRRRSWWSVAAVLGILAVAVAVSARGNETWLAFFYFASTGASPLLPRQRTLALITLAGVTAGVTLFVLTGDAGGAALQGVSVMVIGLLVFSVNETRRTNRALVEARYEIARLAVADERARIARDLHDTLGHSLTLITLKSELAGRLIHEDPDRAGKEIRDVEHTAREALASVRETVTGYRTPTLEGELADARRTLAAANIDTEIEGADAALPQPVDSVFAWTIREAVTNTVRHSGATRVRIRIARSGEWAVADVIDNGRGVGSEPDAAGEGSGLKGLAERIHALGGHLDAGPAGDGGFRLDVRLPLDPAMTEP